jgi:uncharacterized protein (UPF0276 family)
MSCVDKDLLPSLGVGISLSPKIAGAICEHLCDVDCLEFIVDNVLNGSLDTGLKALVPTRPLLAHGIDSSIGSLEERVDSTYLQKVARTTREFGCLWFSDHLAFTHSQHVAIDKLMPVQFSPENLQLLAHKIRAVNDALDIPFLIENVPYYFKIPGSTLQEIDFIVGLLQETRCGLLLDLHNLYTNSINHGVDPYEFIDRLPAAAVVEVHVAGGEFRDGVYIDTHGHPLRTEVLELLDYTIATKRPKAVVLEREKNFPPIGELLAEVHELQRIWARHCGQRPLQKLLPARAGISILADRLHDETHPADAIS